MGNRPNLHQHKKSKAGHLCKTKYHCSLDLIGRENLSDANKGIRSLVLGSPAWELDFFKTLCKKLLESGGKIDIWALNMLLFAFNLLARLNRIFKLRLNHIFWEMDCMYIIYADSKSDKQGNDRSPKHVMLHICFN